MAGSAGASLRGWGMWPLPPKRVFVLGLLLLKPRLGGVRLPLQFIRGAGDLVGRCSGPFCVSLLSLASILLRWQAATGRWVILPSVLILL